MEPHKALAGLRVVASLADGGHLIAASARNGEFGLYRLGSG